jgi:hypothetical protein
MLLDRGNWSLNIVDLGLEVVCYDYLLLTDWDGGEVELDGSRCRIPMSCIAR